MAATGENDHVGSRDSYVPASKATIWKQILIQVRRTVDEIYIDLSVLHLQKINRHVYIVPLTFDLIKDSHLPYIKNTIVEQPLTPFQDSTHRTISV